MQVDTVGKVIAVSGHLVKVEIDKSKKSAIQSSLDGVQTVVAINAYLTFDIGAGDLLLGIVTDLFAQEGVTLDNDSSELQFSQPKRVAFVQLLGTLRSKKGNEFEFSPSVTIMPTLDSHAFIASIDVLRSVFTDAPKRALMDNNENSDGRIELGQPLGTTAKEAKAYGSFNDLFSRPLAVVGNTGSGKSYTIASLLHQAIKEHQSSTPKFFILDINGEYSASFGKKAYEPEPNAIFVNGGKFTVPAWLMNSREVCDWLRAGEGVQQPVLKSFWALAKSGKVSIKSGTDASTFIDKLEAILKKESKQKDNVMGAFNEMKEFVAGEDVDKIETNLKNIKANNGWVSEIPKIRDILDSLNSLRTQNSSNDFVIQNSSDSPNFISRATLANPEILFTEAIKGENESNIRSYIQTLKLRLKNRIADNRWACMTQYDESIQSISDWLKLLELGTEESTTNSNKHQCPEVCVIDCSMLAHEVLPYVCGIIGRLLLEVRSHANADQRHRNPWVVVLEEAHNYIRPRRQDEDAGLTISRDSFERIAKEGRKFGLSLMVASQRPSEISPTVLSQCANYIIHRLQNPDDIGHFKDVVPSQSRRLLDQVMLFGPGEAILIGSAFHIPARVTIRPLSTEHEPKSKTSCPFYDWKNKHEDTFNLSSALKNWIGNQE
jgi:hypothetical protein